MCWDVVSESLKSKTLFLSPFGLSQVAACFNTLVALTSKSERNFLLAGKNAIEVGALPRNVPLMACVFTFVHSRWLLSEHPEQMKVSLTSPNS